MAAEPVPIVRTLADLAGREACDLVLVEGTNSPVPCFLAERALPAPPPAARESARLFPGPPAQQMAAHGRAQPAARTTSR